MAVNRLILLAALVGCLALGVPAWAGTLQFHGFDFAGQGQLSFTPGLGNTLSIGAGGGGNGAIITDFFNSGILPTFCAGDCPIVGGYLTLTTGAETSGSTGGGSFSYSFGGGGMIQVIGEIPTLGINSPTTLFSAKFLPVGTTFSGSGTVGSLIGQLDLSTIMLAAQLGMYKYTGGSNDDLSFSISPSCATGGKCTGTLVQSDTSLQTIPEPATLSVLGVGLFTFGAGLRRRMATR